MNDVDKWLKNAQRNAPYYIDPNSPPHPKEIREWVHSQGERPLMLKGTSAIYKTYYLFWVNRSKNKVCHGTISDNDLVRYGFNTLCSLSMDDPTLSGYWGKGDQKDFDVMVKIAAGDTSELEQFDLTKLKYMRI